MTGANITPPDHTDPAEEPTNDRLSPNPKVTFFLLITNSLTSLLISVHHLQKHNGKSYQLRAMYLQDQQAMNRTQLFLKLLRH